MHQIAAECPVPGHFAKLLEDSVAVPLFMGAAPSKLELSRINLIDVPQPIYDRILKAIKFDGEEADVEFKEGDVVDGEADVVGEEADVEMEGTM
ncbi:hypothetical protein LTR10_018554 [Elasticomyces elasticus]|uniref:Uncharacterized protein n=1 Tax=Exophiala sideris TaxID=1016849 RepID=A0ABR0JQE3_9EURO|nr:hypothetical protein LTR10_018554 [Elasticomyces elasticus]KAK5038035.1 hypothetical protein LTS07_001503 [Exophiala sideris]KAK5044017.1 hypothetical protein LTR13_000373 [Exophiala sideris]KAK5067516.1 hypothetical protein LTR69_001505 [Exophiala sideris]KAK5184246.1 hypothetical protein LTR44_003752 [Eurotiomycetes sp. CCFEE 6388]